MKLLFIIIISMTIGLGAQAVAKSGAGLRYYVCYKEQFTRRVMPTKSKHVHRSCVKIGSYPDNANPDSMQHPKQFCKHIADRYLGFENINDRDAWVQANCNKWKIES